MPLLRTFPSCPSPAAVCQSCLSTLAAHQLHSLSSMLSPINNLPSLSSCCCCLTAVQAVHCLLPPARAASGHRPHITHTLLYAPSYSQPIALAFQASQRSKLSIACCHIRELPPDQLTPNTHSLSPTISPINNLPPLSSCCCCPTAVQAIHRLLPSARAASTPQPPMTHTHSPPPSLLPRSCSSFPVDAAAPQLSKLSIACCRLQGLPLDLTHP